MSEEPKDEHGEGELSPEQLQKVAGGAGAGNHELPVRPRGVIGLGEPANCPTLGVTANEPSKT